MRFIELRSIIMCCSSIWNWYFFNGNSHQFYLIYEKLNMIPSGTSSHFMKLDEREWDSPVRLEARLSGPLSAPGGAFAERFPAVAWPPCFQARWAPAQHHPRPLLTETARLNARKHTNVCAKVKRRRRGTRGQIRTGDRRRRIDD